MSSVNLSERPTGPEVYAAIEAHAASLGKPITDVARALHNSPSTFLKDISRAGYPLTGTVERVRAFLEGRPLPPKRGYQRSDTIITRFHPGKHGSEPGLPGPRVYRDPCLRCGVRGDIGCSHQPANQGEPI